MSTILLVGAFGLCEWALLHGLTEPEARTITVNVSVFVQMFYLFNCRSLTYSVFHVGLFSNPWIWLGVGIMTVPQIFDTYSSFMNRVFASAPLEAMYWALVLAVAVIAYAIVGFEKWIRQWLVSARHERKAYESV